MGATRRPGRGPSRTPDQANTLKNDPKSAIRLANNGTWNAALGLNKLGTIQVK